MEQLTQLFEQFGFRIDAEFNARFRQGEGMRTTAGKIKSIAPLFLVSDLERSIEFYANKLGFDVLFQYQDFYASVARDGYEIHLKIGTRTPRGKDDLDVNCSVEGLDALYEEWTSQSVEVAQPLRDMPYGREFYIADPDGHILGFVEPR